MHIEGAFTGFFVSFLAGILFNPWLVKYLKKLQHSKSSVKEFMPREHLKKKNTPSMGGILPVLLCILCILLFCNMHSLSVLIVLFTIISFGIIGLMDDIKKLFSNLEGLSPKTKLLFQIICSSIIVFAINKLPFFSTKISFSLFTIDLKILYFPFAILMISFMSNAVNLTDGLDGLAGFCIFIASVGMGITIEMSAHPDHNLTIICGAIAGANLAFLWFNSYPASVFMGDVSSLSFGAILAVISIISKIEFVFWIISSVFIVEGLSSALQISCEQLKIRKFLLMAPLHHHFELTKVPETKITARFCICAILSAVFGVFISIYS